MRTHDKGLPDPADSPHLHLNALWHGRSAASFCGQAVDLLLTLCQSITGSCVPALTSAGAVREIFLNNLKQGSETSREAAKQLLAMLAVQVA